MVIVIHSQQDVVIDEMCAGITPMLQIIRHIFKDPQDSTDLSLLFANQVTENLMFFFVLQIL